ncbi:MAG: hypothetical protein FJZ04_02695 [Candidatus Moranbacteria bacterium]|nr:hypothetical protein [Candidatus Moranbacteria bacterium]
MDLRKGVIVSRTNLIESKKETPLPWKGALTTIFLSLAILGGTYYYNWSVKNRISQLQNTINQAKQGRDYQKIALVADSENRLKSIRAIRDERIDWEKIFQKIEENTIPEVTYSQMDAFCGEDLISASPGEPPSKMSLKEKCSIEFKGTTIGLDNLARQISSFTETRDAKGELFAKDASIQKVEIKKTESEPSESKGVVDFTIQVRINPEILDKNATDSNL